MKLWWACLILLSFPSAYAKISICHQFLNPIDEKATVSDTDSFIAYINYLFTQQVIKEDDLINLLESVKKKGPLTNPVVHQVTEQGVIFNQVIHEIHYRNIEPYLSDANLDRKKIIQALKHILQVHQKVRRSKDQANEETKMALIGMKFLRVQKGKFTSGEGANEMPAEIPNDFEVMTTPVTQGMWVKEMEKNPSFFNKGDSGIVIKVGEQLVKLQPNNPVENITWYSAAMFANHMSRRRGLKEVYNFNGVKFKEGTSAADGTLDIESGEVKINGSNVYETEGFRLPTTDEQEFMMKDRGRASSLYFTGLTNQNLKDYAWFQENSGGTTRPVIEKQALIIDGDEIYDLLGNVTEFSTDISTDKTNVLVRGGSWDYLAFYLRSAYRDSLSRHKQSEHVGFRLVRTLK